MKPQPIDKNLISDLSYPLKREYVKCNRGGACTASSIIMCNTKKWHSLLSVFREQAGCQYVLLSALDDSVITNDRSFYLSTRKYPNVYFPLGHQYIDSVSLNPMPSLIYNLADTVLQKEVLLLSQQNTVMVRYKVLSAPGVVTLQLRPLLGLRYASSLIRKTGNINTGNKPIENGIMYSSTDRDPMIYMQMSKQCSFVTAPDWNYNIEYTEDRMAGLPYQEDLFMPGFFETTLNEGESVIFATSDRKGQPNQFETLFDTEAASRTNRESYQDDVNYAVNQLIRTRKGQTFIVNSLPETANIPKEVFMALPGLTLQSNEPNLFEKVVSSLSKMLGNTLMGRVSGYRLLPEAPLWFVWAVQQYFFQKGDIRLTYKQFGKDINKIIKAGIDNSMSGLVLDDSGLVARSLSTEDRYFVETNALWYNALCFAAEINELNGEIEASATASQMAHKVKTEFAKMFVLPNMLYLPDSVSENGSVDHTCRPAQILAAALPYAVVDNNMAEKILLSLQQHLLTPRGLLNIPPQQNVSNESVYVMPEFNDFVAELYLKLRIGDEGMKMAKQMYYAHNQDDSLPSSPCFYQKFLPEAPQEGFGSPLCAASVAAVNRIKMLIDQY